jgi:glycogen(starch) synthase
MNIWLVTSEFPPWFGGGISTYAYNAARMFSLAGHQVTVLTQDTQASDRLEGERLRVVRFVPKQVRLEDNVPPDTPPDEHPAFPFTYLSYWPALSYQFADEIIQCIQRYGCPDVIEVQDYNAIGYYLIQRKLLGESLLADLPVVVHLHSPSFGIRHADRSPQYLLPEYWIGQMEKFCMLSADALLTQSHFMSDWLSEWDARFPTATVIPLPYHHAELSPAQPMPGHVVYIGRLEVRKGVIPLVEACAKLWGEGQDFRLTLIGEDRRYDPLGIPVGEHLKRRFARYIAAGQLCLAGPLPREEVLTRLSQAWCAVIPSLWEVGPITCIEAMSLGKVVVASASGGQAEMIGNDDLAGIVFNWEKKGEFEKALLRVLAMTPEQNQEMGGRAAERIRRLTSCEVVLPQRLAHFQKVLESAPRSRRIFPTVSRFQPAPANVTRSQDSIPGLLSVVIPYYNLGKYIEETLDSVLRSTYPHLEVLIVNDGSDEAESIAALERIEALRKENVRILSIENQGVCAVRNIGAAQVSGEFLSFVDADDLVEPGFFSRCIRILNTYENVGFVYCWASYFGETTGCWPTWNTEFPFFLGHCMTVSFAVTRRHLFLAYGKNKPDMEYNLEDYDSWLGIATRGYLGVSIPKILGHYRIRGKSRLRGINRDQELYLYERIVQHYADEYQRYGPELFNLLNANGPSLGWVSPASRSQATQAELELQAIKSSYTWRIGQKIASSLLGRVMGWVADTILSKQ